MKFYLFILSFDSDSISIKYKIIWHYRVTRFLVSAQWATLGLLRSCKEQSLFGFFSKGDTTQSWSVNEQESRKQALLSLIITTMPNPEPILRRTLSMLIKTSVKATPKLSNALWVSVTVFVFLLDTVTSQEFNFRCSRFQRTKERANLRQISMMSPHGRTSHSICTQLNGSWRERTAFHSFQVSKSRLQGENLETVKERELPRIELLLFTLIRCGASLSTYGPPSSPQAIHARAMPTQRYSERQGSIYRKFENGFPHLRACVRAPPKREKQRLQGA